MAIETYDLNTNGGGGGEATAANQVAQIALEQLIVDYLQDIDSYQAPILTELEAINTYNRPNSSNLHTFIDTQPSLSALQTNIQAFYASFPGVFVISTNIFTDGFLPGGLAPAGYSCVITYSTV